MFTMSIMLTAILIVLTRRIMCLMFNILLQSNIDRTLWKGELNEKPTLLVTSP